MIKILHLANTRTAKALLEHAGKAPTKGERNIGVSSGQSIAYFNPAYKIILYYKSVIMGLFSASLTLLFVLVFHAIS